MIQTAFFNEEESIPVDLDGLLPMKLEDVIPDKNIVPNKYIIYPKGGHHPFYKVPDTFPKYQQMIWPHITSTTTLNGIIRVKKLRPDFGKTERYPRLTFITNNDKTWDTSIHILFAKAWIPNPENKPYVCHQDDNFTNFLLENLKWGTASENNKGKIRRRPDTMEDKYLSYVNKGVIKS
tara:strand:- start:9 stop:545 length:537 start_codon:yes stop_codon:yes gene_type:complete